MDTWATSSLSAQIVSGWVDDPDLFAAHVPDGPAPAGHEIIRTWLFYSVVRSHYEHGLPWANAPSRASCSIPTARSFAGRGNAPDDPTVLIETYGADAVRYWAAGGRPGMDLALDQGQMKIGKRLATKLLNACASPLGTGATTAGEVTEPLDRSMLASLADLVTVSTEAFDRFDYARALERTEAFFWSFCDDYLEPARQEPRTGGGRCRPGVGPNRPRARTADPAPAVRAASALRHRGLVVVAGSIHRSSWPDADGLRDQRRWPAGGGRPVPNVLAIACGAGRGPPGQERGQTVDAGPGRVGDRHRQRRPPGAAGAGGRRRPQRGNVASHRRGGCLLGRGDVGARDQYTGSTCAEGHSGVGSDSCDVPASRSTQTTRGIGQLDTLEANASSSRRRNSRIT